MRKRNIIVFFLILFSTFIVTPSIMMIFSDSKDVAIFYNSSEEEEEKSIEKYKNLEELVQTENTLFELFTSLKTKVNVRHQLKAYTKPYFNLISPPPDNC